MREGNRLILRVVLWTVFCICLLPEGAIGYYMFAPPAKNAPAALPPIRPESELEGSPVPRPLNEWEWALVCALLALQAGAVIGEIVLSRSRRKQLRLTAKAKNA